MSFQGFPAAALDFYDDLEANNTKSFWEANKHIYEESVLTPLQELCQQLEPDFGTAKIFRPYRQLRFSSDKTPYKTHQGAFIPAGPETGFYFEISARGVRTGAGFYWAPPPRLAAFRKSIAEEQSGIALTKIVSYLESHGYERGGERLKTQPRGYDAEHPRINLLRHKSLTFIHQIGFDPVMHTPELAGVVRHDWNQYRPLVGWIGRHLPAETT